MFISETKGNFHGDMINKVYSTLFYSNPNPSTPEWLSMFFWNNEIQNNDLSD